MGVRARTYVPSMSAAAVKARTGKDWQGWFRTLDKAGATKLTHAQIAQLLARKHRVPAWWSQMVSVEFERARGLRQRHETARGFSVAISRTMPAALAHLYAATAGAAERRKWFPTGVFEPTSQTRDKYLRGRWKQRARVEIGFLARAPGRSQVAVQVNRLGKKSEVEPLRAAWKAALSRLQLLLGK